MRRLFRAQSIRDIAVIILPLAVLLALAFWGLTHYVQPAPPSVVVMSTGSLDGAYHAYAQRYQDHLAQYGIRLELKPSAGAVENLERIKSRTDGVTVALIQGGIANEKNAQGLVTLGSLFYELFWIFYRSEQRVDFGNQLRGKRIAIGAPGSGTRAVGLRLMQEMGIAGPPTVVREIGGLDAAEALEKGEVDAVFYVAAADSPAVQRLMGAPGVAIMDVRRAETFVRRNPFLHKLTLPEGAANLARNVPARDLTMLAVMANLIAVEDIHPVIVDLMLEAARKVHGGAGLFQQVREFPAPRDLDLPLSPDADRIYKGSPSILRRYLPFWMVVWVNRFIVIGLPLIIVAIPIIRNLPALYRWRMRRRIYRWYGELRAIEDAARRKSGDSAALAARLDQFEEQVDRLRVPNAYSAELYTLFVHIRLVRDLLKQPSQDRKRGEGVAEGLTRPQATP